RRRILHLLVVVSGYLGRGRRIRFAFATP
ncbi:MAG: hypothetical protein AMXMBFR84_43540, partial [Candidatus Hydrogenedentota bacterium]